MGLAELIRGLATDNRTVALASEFGKAVGKAVVLAKDSPVLSSTVSCFPCSTRLFSRWPRGSPRPRISTRQYNWGWATPWAIDACRPDRARYGARNIARDAKRFWRSEISPGAVAGQICRGPDGWAARRERAFTIIRVKHRSDALNG